MREKIRTAARPWLDRLYARFPAFARKAKPPLLASVLLSGLLYLIAILLMFGLSILGLAGGFAYPGFVKFLCTVPGAIIMADRGAKFLHWAGYFIFSWMLMTMIAVLAMFVIWGFIGD